MRGFWHTVEAVIAITIIITFVTTITGGTTRIQTSEDIEIKAYKILKNLDEKGLLRSYAINDDYSGLNSQVELYMYNHSVEICRSVNQCVGEKPDTSDVWVGNYIISGDEEYAPRIIKLYLY
jgi:hypothetical protein